MKIISTFGLAFSFVLLLPNNAFSQDLPAYSCDVIVLKNGSETKGKILEISPTEIKYKKCDYIDGPTISVLKSDVFMLKYANGTKEVIVPDGYKKGSATPTTTAPSATTSNAPKLPLPSVLSLGVGFSGVGFLKRVDAATYEPNTNPNLPNFNPYDKLEYSSTPVLAGSYDYGVSDIFSVGVAASYQSFTEQYSSTKYASFLLEPTFKVVTTRTNIAVRPLFHISNTDKFDLYGGLRIGYTIWEHNVSTDKIKVEFPSFEQDGFALQALLGMRYFFGDFIGVGLELSIGSPYFTMAGVNFKF